MTAVIVLTEHQIHCHAGLISFMGHSQWWYKERQLGTLLSSLYHLLSSQETRGGKELAVLLFTAVCQGPPCCLLQGSHPPLGRSEKQQGHCYLPLSEQSTEETLFEETEKSQAAAS